MDERGNIYVNPGSVIDATQATTAFYLAGANVAQGETGMGGYRIPTIYNSVPVGGSGYSVNSSGTLSGTLSPVGKFIKIKELEWIDQYGNTMVYDGLDAEISDATDVIATYSTAGTTAPVGTFTLTTYGKDTYNGGSAGTLTTTYEGGGAATKIIVSKDYGEAQVGIYSSNSWGSWTSDDDSDFIANLLSDGTAEIVDSTNVIAIRAAGSTTDPSGTYVATSYGETTYGDGSTFSMFVSFNPAYPITGYAYIELVKSSGSITSVRGPFFATSLPANSSTLEVVPVCYSNGTSLIQIQRGAVYFR
jgi:hypothetical protein